jgi:hypothetical protein
MSASILFRNKPFDGVRLTYNRVLSPSTPLDSFYAEANGERYYYDILGTTQSSMEASTFNAFISFTMSGAVTHFIPLVPLEPGTSVQFDMKVSAVNAAINKGLVSYPKGGFIHTGTAITPIGGTAGLTYDIRKDFTGCNVDFLINGTSSVSIRCAGQTGETLDWNVSVSYVKHFNVINNPTPPPPGPVYPQFPTS